MLNSHDFLPVRQNGAKELARLRLSEEVVLIWGLVVGVAGRDHHALDASFHQLIEVPAHAVGVGTVEQRRVGRNAEARSHRRADSLHRDIVAAFAAHRKVVMLLLAVHVDREREILRRFEQMQLLLQQKRIGAHVDVLLTCNQTGDDLRHLRVQQRLTTGNRHHRRSTLFYRPEALLRAQLRFQNMCRILNLSATRTCQVAAEQRLQHQHQRISLPSFELLLQDIRCNSPGLRNWYGHSGLPPKTNL